MATKNKEKPLSPEWVNLKSSTMIFEKRRRKTDSAQGQQTSGRVSRDPGIWHFGGGGIRTGYLPSDGMLPGCVWASLQQELHFQGLILFYLIAWIVFPGALPLAEKLQMRGEPINIKTSDKRLPISERTTNTYTLKATFFSPTPGQCSS